MADKGFNFDELGDSFDEQKIYLEEMAKGLVPMFLAFRDQGLSTQEAASLTAAFCAQMVPQAQAKPKED